MMSINALLLIILVCLASLQNAQGLAFVTGIPVAAALKAKRTKAPTPSVAPPQQASRVDTSSFEAFRMETRDLVYQRQLERMNGFQQ